MSEHRTLIYRDEVYQLPFADLFRPLTGDEAKRLADSITAHGVKMPVVTFDSTCWGARCVLDGANRLTTAVAAGVEVPFVDLGPLGEKAAKELAISLNVDRRQLSVEEQKAARVERLKRVREARGQGESLRSIAQKEGVSVGQVQRDLKGASGDAPKPKVGAAGASPDAPHAGDGGASGDAPAKGKDDAARAAAAKKLDEPEPTAAEPEVVVTHASAEKAIAVVEVVVRALKKSKAMLSGLMAGPYSQLIRNVSESVTNCKVYATGEMLSKGEWGSVKYGIDEHSTPAIDDMMTLCGGMKQALARADAVEVGGPKSAPWESADFDAVLRSDDDKVAI